MITELFNPSRESLQALHDSVRHLVPPGSAVSFWRIPERNDVGYFHVKLPDGRQYGVAGENPAVFVEKIERWAARGFDK